MVAYLIINADDFGMSSRFNEAILDLARKSLISSVTVMVARIEDDQKQQIKELVSYNISVGLHLEFKGADYSMQIRSQYKKFIEIFGFTPSHIDIHKSRQFKDSFEEVARFCQEKPLPCRNRGVEFLSCKTTETVAFYGSVPDFNEIKDWVLTLKNGNYYEILFHPGKYDPHCTSSYNTERERDVTHILKLHEILEGIKVVSYLEL